MINRTKRSRPARSLTATLAIAFFSLSVVALLVSGVLQTYANFQTQQQAIASKQQLLAQGAASTVSSFIQNEISVMETTVRLASPARASTEEQSRILNNLLGLQPAFRQVVLLDAQGQETVLASRVSRMATGEIIAQLNSENLAQIQQGQKYISAVYFDELTSEPFIVIAIPATSVLGDFEGFLLAEVNLKFMWDLVDRLKVGETGVTYVVDRQGNLIAYKDTARVLKGENVSNIKMVGAFANNLSAGNTATSELYTGIESGTVVGTYIPLGTPDWAVVSELPWQEAYQQVIQQAIFSGVIILVIAVFASLVGVYLARRLTVPLINLTETATRITSGETDLQAEIKGPREVASLATTFNSMTHQLRQTLATLEQRVADRTRAVETSSEISRRLSTILDQKQLALTVVEEVQRAFNYYHAHIYLYDEKDENLVMVGGTGEVGQLMLGRGHTIPRGRGLVGQAAEMNQVVLVSDTQADPSWLPNPLLPDTKSEVAVPIAIGDRVLGVLDVQHNIVDGLTQQDVDLLQSIANQVAVATQNAELFTQTQRQADQEALVNAISQKIQTATSVEGVLQVMARELGAALKAQRAYVQVGGSAVDRDVMDGAW
jgi:putative methionine-R-sulfoxide reductase with GAF domain